MACIYAALHIVGLIVLWAVVVGICKGSAGLACVAAIVAAGIFSYFILRSFITAFNNCRAGR